MNKQTDQFAPGKKVIARTVPEGSTINEEGLELLTIDEVKALTDISTSGIYARARDEEDDFPESVDVGAKGKGSKKMWVRLEVLQFIAQRMEQRRTTPSSAPTVPAYAQKLDADQRRILDNRRLGKPDSYVPVDEFGEEAFNNDK